VTGVALPAAFADLLTPALLVDRGRLQRNIDTMVERYRSAGLALRPHIKTSKCWQVAERQLAAGAIGFTCSTSAEVRWLQARGVTELLWAHQPVGPRKVEFVMAASQRGGLTIALDSVEAAEPISRAATSTGITVKYLLEVDTGQGRAGVEPDDVVDRAREIGRLPGLDLRGVMTHEGHLGTFGSDRVGLERAGRAAGALLVHAADQLRSDGFDAGVVSVGSTPGSTSSPYAEGVTEARPGTYIYYDANQVRLSSATSSECALTVLARVVSTQRSGTAIIDAGIKAMSSDAIATLGSLGLVCSPVGSPLEGVRFSEGNEEHGFLTGPGVTGLAVGDIVRIIPNHACGTTNMFSSLWAVDADRAVESWLIHARH